MGTDIRRLKLFENPIILLMFIVIVLVLVVSMPICSYDSDMKSFHHNGPFVLIRERGLAYLGPLNFRHIQNLASNSIVDRCPFLKMHGNWAVLESMFRKGEGGGQTAIKRPDVGMGGNIFAAAQCCLLLGNILANCLQAKTDPSKQQQHCI